jgi:hypothetical protein
MQSTDLGITLSPRDDAHLPRKARAASQIELTGRHPTSELYMHETRILGVDYTEEQAQWKHGYLGRGTARSSELLHGGGGRENDATYWLVGGKRLAESPGEGFRTGTTPARHGRPARRDESR